MRRAGRAHADSRNRPTRFASSLTYTSRFGYAQRKPDAHFGAYFGANRFGYAQRGSDDHAIAHARMQ